VCPSKVKLRTEKPLIVFPAKVWTELVYWASTLANRRCCTTEHFTSQLAQVLRRVAENLLGLRLLRVYVTVAYPALQTAGPAAVQLNFNAGGIRLVGVFIYRLTIALSLGRDQIVNRVAENAAGEREMLSKPLLHYPFEASDFLRPKLKVVVVEGPKSGVISKGMGARKAVPYSSSRWLGGKHGRSAPAADWRSHQNLE